MMKKIFHKLMLAGGTALCCLTAGCALTDPDTSILSPAMWGEIARNRENLGKLRGGMTKDEVLAVMGEPLRGQVYATDNEWWYYTRTLWSDGMATRDECTPLVFGEESGLLEGWGVDYYRNSRNFVGWTDKAVIQVLE